MQRRDRKFGLTLLAVLILLGIFGEPNFPENLRIGHYQIFNVDCTSCGQGIIDYWMAFDGVYNVTVDEKKVQFSVIYDSTKLTGEDFKQSPIYEKYYNGHDKVFVFLFLDTIYPPPK